MSHPIRPSPPSPQLPTLLRPLFWDDDFEALAWENDRDLIIARVLTSGGWDAITWLRFHMGDRALREWIERHQGRGLSPRQLRFWEGAHPGTTTPPGEPLACRRGAKDLGEEGKAVRFHPEVLHAVQKRVLW